MKTIVQIFLLYVISSSLILSQDESTGGELNFYIRNNNGSNVKIEMELVSSLCWKTDPNDDDLHDTTHSFGGGYLSTNYNLTFLQFLGCWESNPIYYSKTFGLGYYKFTAKVNNIIKDEFFIDYRTSDLPENFGSGDILIDFNVYDGKFYYPGTQYLFPTYTSIWEQKPWIDSITTELEPLQPDYFDLTSSSGHPYLTWYHSYDDGDYWTGYCIYRSVVSGCGSDAGSFTKIATLSKQSTYYTDNSFIVNGPMTAHYKITAINGERESDFTETLDICVGLNKESTIEQQYDFGLSQNYPNPFNPTTEIAFSIKENSFVSLKVYDILGREVAELINKELNSGNHTIEFNGQNLKSGIYFYEIRANEFRDVKKLILLK